MNNCEIFQIPHVFLVIQCTEEEYMYDLHLFLEALYFGIKHLIFNLI